MEVRVSKKNPVPNTQKMKKLEPLIAEKLWDKTRNLKMLQKPLQPFTCYNLQRLQSTSFSCTIQSQEPNPKNKKVQVIKEK